MIVTDIIDDEDFDSQVHPVGSARMAAYREPATLSIAGMAIALVSFLSQAPGQLAQVILGESSFFSLNTFARASSAVMALLAAVGLGFGMAALRAEREDGVSWVRPLAAAAVLVAGLAIVLATVTFVVALMKDSPPALPDFSTGD
jgi:hypothetical protein